MQKCKLFFLLLICSACQSTPPIPKQELRLVLATEPPSLDARLAADVISASVIRMCSEGLMRADANGKSQFALAETVDISEDQKTYTFHLRESYWADGKPLTAHEFEETWKSILDPASLSQRADALYIIKNARAAKEGTSPLDQIGVRASDDRTLIVELTHPTPYFSDLVASHFFLPVRSDDYMIGNGPFKITSWRHYNEIVLEKNERYWDAAAVKLSKIHLAILEDHNTELNLFQNGEIDWAGHPLSALPTDALETLKRKGDLKTYPLAATYYYVFNTTTFPFNNVHLRRAFALAMNRQAIVSHVTQGEQTPATGLVPPTMWPEKISYFQDHDVEEARREFKLALEEMGIEASALPPITLIYNTDQSHHKVAQAVQEQWFRAFGIRVGLANKEWKVYLDELTSRQFQVARLGGIAYFNDPICFLDHYRYAIGCNNHSGWCSAEFATLLEKADETTNAEERTAFLRAAEALLIEEMPIAPVYFYTGSYLKKNAVKGVFLSELSDVDFKEAYLDHK
jgi:oligopeptide transport system substrate-binding protein